MRGVWVYEIGTSPYFTNVAPGEVTDLPTDAPGQGGAEGDEEAVPPERPVHNDGQQVEYPPYEPDGQVLVHTVQFKPQNPNYTPEDPQVVVVDDGDINVDGGSDGARSKQWHFLRAVCCGFHTVSTFHPAMISERRHSDLSLVVHPHQSNCLL